MRFTLLRLDYRCIYIVVGISVAFSCLTCCRLLLVSWRLILDNFLTRSSNLRRRMLLCCLVLAHTKNPWLLIFSFFSSFYSSCSSLCSLSIAFLLLISLNQRVSFSTPIFSLCIGLLLLICCCISDIFVVNSCRLGLFFCRWCCFFVSSCFACCWSDLLIFFSGRSLGSYCRNFLDRILGSAFWLNFLLSLVT